MLYKATVFQLLALLILIVLLANCGGNEPPAQIVEATQIPPGVEVVNITESQTTINEITQQKTFDQCASASPLKTAIKFGSSSGQEAQEQLVLRGDLGAEVGVSAAAKIKIGGSIQQHFLTSSSSGDYQEESISIEVPPYTKQEYTIVWQENRRDGQVEYIENGETKYSNFSYRLGVELFSSAVVDLVCPNQIPLIQPTNTRSPTQVGLPESSTTEKPAATSTSAPTSLPQPEPIATLDTGLGSESQNSTLNATIIPLGQTCLTNDQFCSIHLKIEWQNIDLNDGNLFIVGYHPNYGPGPMWWIAGTGIKPASSSGSDIIDDGLFGFPGDVIKLSVCQSTKNYFYETEGQAHEYTTPPTCSKNTSPVNYQFTPKN